MGGWVVAVWWNDTVPKEDGQEKGLDGGRNGGGGVTAKRLNLNPVKLRYACTPHER